MRQRFLIYFSFLFSVVSIYGKENVPIDSIIDRYKSTLNDTAKIKELLLISRFYFDNNNQGAIKPFIDKMEELVEIEEDNKQKAEIYFIIGNCLSDSAPDKSIQYFNHAINFIQNNPKDGALKLLGEIYASYGWIYQLHGEYEPAIEKYLYAEKFSARINDYPALISIYSKLGDIYNKLGSAKEADKYFSKAFSLAGKTINKKALAKCLSASGTKLVREKKYNEAEEKFLEALKLGKDIGDLSVQHNLSYNLGFLFSQQEKYQEALKWYTISYNIALENKNQYDVSDALYKIGLVLLYMQKFNDSEVKLNTAMSIADSIHSKILRRNILDVYYSLEDGRGNYKKACIYLNQYIDVVNEIFSEEDQQQVNFLKAQFETEKKETQIANLVREKEYKDKILKRRNLLILSIGLISIMTVILLLSLILNQRNKRKISEQENRLAEEKIKQLQKDRQIESAHAVLQGEEAERSRLARDLHDGLGGLLSGIKLNLTNMKSKFIVTQESVDQFDYALNLLDNSIRELRRVAHNMMPEALIKFGLKDALHDFCSQLDNSSEVSFKFQFYGEDKRIENAVEISMYRIAQELLNNIVKHSQASEVIVQLIQEEKRVNLTIQDNGIGFDPASLNISKGAGLSNIRARVESLNGRLDIDSKQGSGTEVIIEFYLADNA